MKPFSALLLALLVFSLAGCGKGERVSADKGAPQAAPGEAAQEPPEPEMDPATCEQTSNGIEMPVCLGLKNDLLADSLAKVLSRWKSQAGSAQGALADRIVAALDAFAEEEAGRAYWQHVEGSIRGTAAGVQEGNVRRNFGARIDSVLERGLLPDFSEAERQGFDADLNRVYSADVAEYVAYQEERIRESPEVSAERSEYAREYRERARAAQRHWIRYRDAWAELASARFPKTESRDPSVAMRALLTRVRVLELCVNTVGGEPSAYCPCYVPERDYGEGCPSSVSE